VQIATAIFTQMEDLLGEGAVFNKPGRLYHNTGQEKQALENYSRRLCVL
jgi:hypothetical protein